MKKLFVILLLFTFSPAGNAANFPDFPFLVGEGVAEKYVKPDIATINLEIMAFNKESETALEKVGVATERVVEILHSYDVDIENIEATDIDKSAKQKRDSEYNRLEILGYEVYRTMTISLDALSQYSELMSEIIAVDNVSGLDTKFDLAGREDLELELLTAAATNARAKAERLANSLDTEITSVHALSQSSGFGSLIASFGASPNFDLNFGAVDLNPTKMFAPKSIKISVSVNVVFRIE